MEARNEDEVITLKVGFLEIYNEEVRDLLHPETPSKVGVGRVARIAAPLF